MTVLLHFIDVFGTFVFALSGATVGARHRFDLLGVFVLAFVTAVGGGGVRDLCLGATPPAGLINVEYLVCVIIAIMLITLFQKIVFYLGNLLCFLMPWASVFLPNLARIKLMCTPIRSSFLFRWAVLVPSVADAFEIFSPDDLP